MMARSNSISAGNLDRIIQFLRADMVDDGYQSRPGAYVPHGEKVWAALRYVSDRERYAAGTVGVDAVARVTVRYSSFTAGITHSDRLLCEGRVFGVVGIKETGRRQWIEITASEVRE